MSPRSTWPADGRAWWASRRCWATSRASPSCTSPGATWSATRSWRTSSTPTSTPRPPPAARAMPVDVFASDEQRDEPVDLDRWVALARDVLADRRVKGDVEVSLLFVDEEAI